MPIPLVSPGAMTVDWEERVDPDRLRTYRLARARAALDASPLGALLLFDFTNIRYVTSTHIGEWARDKMTRYALLTRGGAPHLWDFGSAAKHHERPIISRLDHPVELKEGMVIALETYCPARDGVSAARIEEEVVVTADGPQVITRFPSEELFVANPYRGSH